MFSDRVFIITFIFSLAIHGLIITQNPGFNFFDAKKAIEKLEVRYLKITPNEKESVEKPANKQELFLKVPTRTLTVDRSPPPFVEKERMFKRNRQIITPGADFTKPVMIKNEAIAVKRKVYLPALEMNKINNPSYINYYQIVREKIKRAAYNNYSRTEIGEIYLSFVISNNGILKGARLDESKSSINQYLKEIALKSINDASPFPAFPKELNYPQLSFNVAVSFEIE